MQVLRFASEIDPDGHLRVDVPTQLPVGRVDLVVVINSDPQKKTSSRKYDFSDLVGKLAWRGNAVAEQRSLRDEW